MKQTTNFDIMVPGLGDRPDITQVSNAIQSLEDALAGTLEIMDASISGSALTLTSPSRKTKRTTYYQGMSIGFIAPAAISPDVMTTATVDELPAQTLSIPFFVNVGEEVFIHYNDTGFVASRFSVPKSNAVDSNSTETCATSRAVKTAYDKASNAQASADSANDNANSKVSKAGDTVNGTLSFNSGRPITFNNGIGLYSDADWAGFCDPSGNANFYIEKSTNKAIAPYGLNTSNDITQNGGNFSTTGKILFPGTGAGINQDGGILMKVGRFANKYTNNIFEILDDNANGRISKTGDDTTGTVTCHTVGSGFGVAFKSQDGSPATNKTGIFGGNDYYGLEKANNLDINSWFGTSFSHSQGATPTIAFNNRSGDGVFAGGLKVYGAQNVYHEGYRGVFEVGGYIDFHREGSTSDFDLRLACTNSGSLELSAWDIYMANNRRVVHSQDAIVFGNQQFQIRTGDFGLPHGSPSKRIYFDTAFPNGCRTVIITGCAYDAGAIDVNYAVTDKGADGFTCWASPAYNVPVNYIAIGW